MGGGDKPHTPRAPLPEPPVKPEDEEVQAAKDKERRRLRMRYNRESTFMSPMPIAESPGGKTVLG